MPDYVDRKFGDLTVRIDRDTCITTENCVEVTPEVFEIDDQGFCRFVDPAGKVDRAKLIEACEICPVEALFVLDADGKQLVP